MSHFKSEESNIPPVTYIPFDQTEDKIAPGGDEYMRYSGQGNVISDEVQLRLDAYHQAWRKCLYKFQSSIQSQYEPIVQDIVQHIRNSYTEQIEVQTLYQELPVVCIADSLSGSSVLDDICTSLDGDSASHEIPSTLKINIHPSDCPNVMSGIKNIMTSLIDLEDVPEPVKRKPSLSVANFDIEMLVAWYNALCDTSKNKAQPLIVIMMHDFEQFDPLVLQDIFYIFSRHASTLHSVFVLLLSSPASPSFLHSAYPRSTLTLLRVDTFVTPSGLDVLKKALQDTFFDIAFEPDIMLGPTMLEQIIHHLKRNNVSQDVFMTSIQLAHLRHFLLNPLSPLVQKTLSLAVLSEPSSHNVVDAISRGLQATNQTKSASSPAKKRKQKDLPQVISAVDQARIDFAARSRQIRLAFGILCFVHEFLENKNVNEPERSRVPSLDLAELMVDALQGSLETYARRLSSPISAFEGDELTSLLDQLHEFFEQPALVKEYKSARGQIGSFLAVLAGEEKSPKRVARDVCDWLEDYIESLVKPLDGLPLWYIWYTGNAPLPSESLNPSVRATILSGLLRPHDYTLDPNPNPDPNSDELPPRDSESFEPELWRFPDTSILFKRYMESGKLVNVYDWFESFRLALEAQRERVRQIGKVGTAPGGRERRSPKRRGKKGKVKSDGGDVEEEGGGGDDDDEDDEEERWKLEVQARFIRAVHELDYLGFIKHTGRKAGHVARTVFDVGD
ncbi:hypothetical protein AX17_007009 [Amanita inopinata Kibby_2008]|nr:hypothetical protein AX17_007009 [Amanita inopinata Kibby_2008]